MRQRSEESGAVDPVAVRANYPPQSRNYAFAGRRQRACKMTIGVHKKFAPGIEHV